VLLSAVARTQPQHVLSHVGGNLTAAACAALGTLRSLRELTVSWTALKDEQQAARRFQDFCAGIGQLTQLTSLVLGPVHPAGLQLLPASLQRLALMEQAAATAAAAVAARAQLDLTHLTALTTLHIMCTDNVTAVQLPAGVSCLDVLTGSIRLTGPHMALRVKLASVTRTSDLLILQDLSTQQQPWRLELRAPSHTAFDAAAAAALSACTSLTALVLQDGAPNSMPWSQHVAALTGLRELEFRGYESEEQDLLQLTALTALTHLSLSCRVNDTVAVALALNLTGLCHLGLGCEGLTSASVLPVTAKLSGLRHLDLASWCADNDSPSVSKALTPVALSQLLPLTQLSYLQLPLGAACPSEARQQFLDSMPGLSSIETGPIVYY
jgi:hypothetical protein